MNLQKTTYGDDVIVSSQLDILIQKIETHVAVIKKKLEDSQSQMNNTSSNPTNNNNKNTNNTNNNKNTNNSKNNNTNKNTNIE